MSESFEVLIVGGGTGGLCLAHGLHKAGIRVKIYERARTRTERLQGYRLHIDPIGSRALHECLPAKQWELFLATTGKPVKTFGFYTEQLKKLSVVDVGWSDPTRGHHAVSRITLHHILSTGLEEVIEYDKKFERYERTPDGKVTCYFADGSSATADVVVAADGSSSKVREQYLPEAKRIETVAETIAGKFMLTEESKARVSEALYAGPAVIMPLAGCGIFIASLEPKPTETPARAGIASDDEARAMFPGTLFDNTSGYTLWAFIAKRRDLPGDASSRDGSALRDLVGQRIKDWHPDVRRMVAESETDSITFIPGRTSSVIPRWESTNITLIGDAIHGMSPALGMGANVALRDAHLLCGSLLAAHRGERTFLDAIRAYETEMHAYGFKAVLDSQRAEQRFVSSNVAARIAFRTMRRVMSAMQPRR